MRWFQSRLIALGLAVVTDWDAAAVVEAGKLAVAAAGDAGSWPDCEARIVGSVRSLRHAAVAIALFAIPCFEIGLARYQYATAADKERRKIAASPEMVAALLDADYCRVDRLLLSSSMYGCV